MKRRRFRYVLMAKDISAPTELKQANEWVTLVENSKPRTVRLNSW